MSDTPKLKLFRKSIRVALVCDWVNKHDLAEQVVSIVDRGSAGQLIYYRAFEEVEETPEEIDRFAGTSARWG